MRTDRGNRLGYHPLPWENGGRARSGRKVERRWTAITRHCELRDAAVLDLGCSGGYMSFKAAEIARRVIAIDADAELIARNRELATERHIDNVEFVPALLTPELMASQPAVDVTFFLSVFHHMITASEAYDWNPDAAPFTRAGELMAAVASRTEVLVFEMGEPHEAHEWARRLPAMEPSPAKWIVRHLLEPHFREVAVVEPPDLAGIDGWLRRQLHYRLPRFETSSTFPARIARRLLGHDTRDARHLFIARRTYSQES